MERDSDGWVEIVLVTQGTDEHQDGKFEALQDGDAEGVTVGHAREVEGTEAGPVCWFDARVIDESGAQERRFTTYAAAVLSMALYEADKSTRRVW